MAQLQKTKATVCMPVVECLLNPPQVPLTGGGIVDIQSVQLHPQHHVTGQRKAVDTHMLEKILPGIAAQPASSLLQQLEQIDQLGFRPLRQATPETTILGRHLVYEPDIVPECSNLLAVTNNALVLQVGFPVGISEFHQATDIEIEEGPSAADVRKYVRHENKPGEAAGGSRVCISSTLLYF